MGNTYSRRRAVVCYPCEAKETTSLVGSVADLTLTRTASAVSGPARDDAPGPGGAVSLDELLTSEFMDFHFVHEAETLEFVKANKVLFVLRGLPGSGKSYITRVLLSIYPDSVAFTADTYLLRHPEMILNPRVLEEAHRHCLNAVAKVVRAGQSPVIVDNTNVTRQEVKQYLRLARSHGYFGLVVEPRTPWRFTPPALAEKTGRKVELAVIQNRLNAWQDLLPSAYACFMNCYDSKLVMEVVDSLLQKVLRSDLVLDDLAKFHGKDISWKSALNGYMKNRGDEHQMLKWIVAKGSDLTPEGFYSLGRVLTFKIVAFLLTPKHVGAKIVPGQMRILSEDAHKDSRLESAVMSVLSGSGGELTIENLARVSDWEDLQSRGSAPGAVEENIFGVRVVRLEPYSFAFYAGRDYSFQGIFTGCYI